MSRASTTPSAEEAIEKLRYDEATRENTQELAERDDDLGATARVFLDLADGNRPKKSDCREAHLMSLWERYQEGGFL